jgi:hypothetical protein
MNAEHLAILSQALTAGTLPPRDVDFASSLVTQASGRGLSDKQWLWVSKLAMRLVAEPTPVLDNMAKVYTLFESAKKHLRYPKIHLSTGERTLKLYVSTQRSRVPNVVNVVDPESNAWFGRVYLDGKWEAGNADPAQVQSVAKALIEFAKDPESVASRSGHLSGNCCFCNRELTDERSTSVGYGKVCADHFGLRWGRK